MQRKKYTLSAVALVSGLILGLTASVRGAQMNETTSSAQRGSLPEKDYHFVEKAARGGLEEVELGQLAEQKGVSQSVRSFGQRMVTDHGSANTELKQLASQKNAMVPTQLSHGERSTMEDLQKLSGVEFDKAYAKDMVKEHRKDVKEFQTQAKQAKDPEVKAWAQKTLAMLQEHLRLAEEMEKTVKSEK